MNNIKCPSCNYKNRPNNNFCTQCGHKLIEDKVVGPRLVVLTKEKSSIVFQIKEKKCEIGRASTNAIIINDDKISNFHAQILNENHQIWIEDLKSTNGVFVNGKKIKKRQLLHDGSLIKLGSTILKFETENENSTTN